MTIHRATGRGLRALSMSFVHTTVWWGCCCRTRAALSSYASTTATNYTARLVNEAFFLVGAFGRPTGRERTIVVGKFLIGAGAVLSTAFPGEV